jgi:4-alpha-glucanotransferase
VWSQPGLFLRGFSIGAPPDPLAPQGQVWGIPPPDPRTMLEDGLDAQAMLYAANMRHAAALRVDHVLGLARLFVVPDGARGSEGAYLAMPQEALLAELSLASHRARCTVIGEDLGTVPRGFRERMAEARVLSTRVLAFERRDGRTIPPQEWPALATACLATHDLPTVAGWWRGADLDERASLGLLADEAGERAAREAERQELRALVGPQPDEDALVAALHAFVSQAPCAMLLVQAEDLAGETVAVNLPGTDRERPNWRRRLPMIAADLLASPRACAILAALHARDAG